MRTPAATIAADVGKLVALPGVFSEIARTFDLMAVAEEVILAERKARKPRFRERVRSCFKLLMPGALKGFGDDLYRHHCREIIQRAVAAEDTRPGTRAEVLAAISGATLASRLDHDVELLALTIANDIFPGRGLLDERSREEIPHALEEHLARFRKKLAQDWRTR